MSDYARANSGGATHFTDKDGLTTGDPNKLIVGSEHDAEFNAILSAANSKYDSTDIANQATAEAGTSNTTLMSPKGVQFWGDANGGMVGDIQALTDPGAEQILGWDDTANAVIGWVAGNGIVLDATSSPASVIRKGLLGLQDLTDPSPLDQLLVFDNTTGVFEWLTATNGLDVNGTDLVITDLAATSTNPMVFASGVPSIDVTALDSHTSGENHSTDQYLVDDAGVVKSMAYKDFGPKVVESSTITTLTAANGNSLAVNTGSVEDTITIPLDAAEDLNIGFQIGIVCQSTAAVLVAAGGTTVYSLNSHLQVKAQGGGAYLVKTGANRWHLVGDLEA